jgi:uncharacterized circularly permuted ATP-grasp superfamily protein
MARWCRVRIDWSSYRPGTRHDELVAGNGQLRPAASPLGEYLASLESRELHRRQQAAERAIVEMGVTFTVYSEGQNIDRAWPFDIIPRVLEAAEWRRVEAGLAQRLRALNCFIGDVYADQRAVRDGIIPAGILHSSGNYLPACAGARRRTMPGRTSAAATWCAAPTARSTCSRTTCACRPASPTCWRTASSPSRCSRSCSRASRSCPVDDYPSQLFDMLASLSPGRIREPRVVVLTPGIYNSAYFEHAYLAQRMGVELVEGADLVVGDDDCVLHAHDRRPRARGRDLLAHQRRVPGPECVPSRTRCWACRG